MASSLQQENEYTSLQDDDISVKDEMYEDSDINPLDFLEVQEEDNDWDVTFHEYDEELDSVDVDDTDVADESGKFGNAYWIRGLSDVPSTMEEVEQKQLTCPECSATFTIISHLETHKILFHSDCKPFSCYKCTKTFARRRTLKAHFISVHHSIGPFECFECSTEFQDEETLKKHVEVDHAPLTPYQCVECGNAYYRKDRLKAHFESVHARLKTKCESCCAQFADKVKLRLHIASSHLNVKSFECPKCNAKFAKAPTLKGHLQTVHCVERPFKCPSCQYYFSSEALLRRHIESIHLDLKPFCCLYCNNRYASKRSVHKHVRTIHRKQSMPRKCPKCSLLFEDKRSANEHYINSDCGNDRERPFLCDVCNASFTQRAHLCVHRKSVHRSPKGLKCPLCDVGFSYKVTLKRHLNRFHNMSLDAFGNNEFETNAAFYMTDDEEDDVQKGKREEISNIPQKTLKCHQNSSRTKNLKDSKSRNSNLDRESVRHFQCDYCPRSFTQINHMYAHRKRIHRSGTAQQCLPYASSFNHSCSLSIRLVSPLGSNSSDVLVNQTDSESKKVWKRRQQN